LDEADGVIVEGAELKVEELDKLLADSDELAKADEDD
jgi:hypothetical protein